jgi:nucleotide-binding universal stress UspA family protein
MATQGHHGVLDALRGSVTERVLRRAPCPLLAVPER